MDSTAWVRMMTMIMKTMRRRMTTMEETKPHPCYCPPPVVVPPAAALEVSIIEEEESLVEMVLE
jgi:hypothetical protein